MPKRGENIHKRKDGRWEARYRTGADASGRATYGSVYARSYREAKAKQAEKVSELARNHPICRQNPQFSQVAELWMGSNRLHLKGASECRYRNLLETHILPSFGERRIASITGAEINAFLADKLQSGRMDGKGGLSPTYVRSIMLVIHSVITFAVENQMRPPLQTKLYKPPMVKRELPILMPAEQSRLVSQCRSHLGPTSLGVLLSLYAGLRIGEICALEWADIDFSMQTIHIRKTVSRVQAPEGGSMLVIAAPKTASSFREIPLCSWLMPLLDEVRSGCSSGYVTSRTAQFVSPRTYDYRYHRLLAQAEVPPINYHALRHTFATRCIEAGMDVKSLSEMLGHANAAVTLNTYVHPSMEVKRSHLEKLAL